MNKVKEKIMGYLDDYFDEGNSYYGVCLNCGSARCGYYGGCTDREKESDTDKEDNNG